MATCQATTQRGTPCQNPAGDDGFCHLESHGPGSKREEREGTTRNPQYDPKRIAQAIRQSGGSLTQAAQRVGCGHMTVYRYVDEFDVCREAKDEARHKGTDKARDTLQDLMDPHQPPNVRARAADSWIKYYDRDTEPDEKRVDHRSEDGSMSPKAPANDDALREAIDALTRDDDEATGA